MELRTPPTRARRFSETVLRFRFPLLLLAAVLAAIPAVRNLLTPDWATSVPWLAAGWLPLVSAAAILVFLRWHFARTAGLLTLAFGVVGGSVAATTGVLPGFASLVLPGLILLVADILFLFTGTVQGLRLGKTRGGSISMAVERMAPASAIGWLVCGLLQGGLLWRIAQKDLLEESMIFLTMGAAVSLVLLPALISLLPLRSNTPRSLGLRK